MEAVNDEVLVQTGQPLGVGDDDLSFARLGARGHIKTTEGRFVAVAIVSEEIRPGVAKTVFISSKAWTNAVMHSVPDPVSGSYRYKLGRGTLRKEGESSNKHALTEMSLKPRPIV